MLSGQQYKHVAVKAAARYVYIWVEPTLSLAPLPWVIVLNEKVHLVNLDGYKSLKSNTMQQWFNLELLLHLHLEETKV